MTIETKYNIGDEVWVNVDGTPMQGKVRYIDIHIAHFLNELRTIVRYGVISYEPPFDGDVVFPTKEELLKSL